MSGQRWRVILAEGGRSFRVEVDTGAGFRLATVVEVDAALRNTSHVVAERSAVERSAEHQRNTRRNVPRSAPEQPATTVITDAERHTSSTRTAERSTAERSERSAEHQRNTSGTFRGTPAERNAEIRRRRAAGESVRQVARALGVGVATVQRAMKE